VRPPAVFSLPQFRLLFSGQAVSVIGDALFPVALAFAVLDDLHGTPGQLGLVLAAETLPLAVLILAAGVWADRLNRRNVMIVCDLGRASWRCTSGLGIRCTARRSRSSARAARR
jgi:MFS family permease